MEWFAIVGVCSWCFVIGTWVGQAAIRRDLEQSRETSVGRQACDLFENATREIDDMLLFADARLRYHARMEWNDRKYVITIEPELAERDRGNVHAGE